LMQVLYNLMSNAAKFNKDDGEIRISADRDAPCTLRLTVSDTGIGIKSGDFAKLFVEFQQLDSGITRRSEGTGLGLALTKKIVEFQAGRIEVQSEFRVGSTFTIHLPMLEPVAIAPEPKDAAA